MGIWIFALSGTAAFWVRETAVPLRFSKNNVFFVANGFLQIFKLPNGTDGFGSSGTASWRDQSMRPTSSNLNFHFFLKKNVFCKNVRFLNGTDGFGSSGTASWRGQSMRPTSSNLNFHFFLKKNVFCKYSNSPMARTALAPP